MGVLKLFTSEKLISSLLLKIYYTHFTGDEQFFNYEARERNKIPFK
jgi:hypothetical protein